MILYDMMKYVMNLYESILSKTVGKMKHEACVETGSQTHLRSLDL